MAVILLADMALAEGNLTLALAAVFLASTEAAVFGPSKYGLLPELLPQKLLSWGNGIIELGTFVAIISAVVVAGIMADAFRGRQAISGLIFLGCSVVDRKSTRLNSSHGYISYAVFCLQKQKLMRIVAAVVRQADSAWGAYGTLTAGFIADVPSNDRVGDVLSVRFGLR